MKHTIFLCLVLVSCGTSTSESSGSSSGETVKHHWCFLTAAEQPFQCLDTDILIPKEDQWCLSSEGTVVDSCPREKLVGCCQYSKYDVRCLYELYCDYPCEDSCNNAGGIWTDYL